MDDIQRLAQVAYVSWRAERHLHAGPNGGPKYLDPMWHEITPREQTLWGEVVREVMRAAGSKKLSHLSESR